MSSTLQLCAIRTVGNAVCLGIVSLPFIHGTLNRLVKAAYVQKAVVLASAEDVFKYAFFVLDKEVAHEPFDLFIHLLWVKCLLMVFLIQLSPFKPALLRIKRDKDATRPSNDGFKIGLCFRNILVFTMLAHIVLDMVLADPFQGCGKNVLSLYIATDVMRPYLQM